MTTHVPSRHAFIAALLETPNQILDQLPPHTANVLSILEFFFFSFVITVAVRLGVINSVTSISTLTKSKHQITHTHTHTHGIRRRRSSLAYKAKASLSTIHHGCMHSSIFREYQRTNSVQAPTQFLRGAEFETT